MSEKDSVKKSAAYISILLQSYKNRMFASWPKYVGQRIEMGDFFTLKRTVKK